MPLIDPQSLRAKTEEAIRKGQEQLVAKRKAEEEEQRRIEEANRLKAELILASIPARCESAAAKGKNRVTVYNIPCEEQTDFNLHILSGVAKLIYDRLISEEITVKIECWHGGADFKSGYDLVVYW